MDLVEVLELMVPVEVNAMVLSQVTLSTVEGIWSENDEDFGQLGRREGKRESS